MRELALSEMNAVSGGDLPHASGLFDSIEGGILDAAVGAAVGALSGGANAGAAGSGGVLGFGILAQGVGFIAGAIFGGIAGGALGLGIGFSHSDTYVQPAINSILNGSLLPKKGLA